MRNSFVLSSIPTTSFVIKGPPCIQTIRVSQAGESLCIGQLSSMAAKYSLCIDFFSQNLSALGINKALYFVYTSQ